MSTYSKTITVREVHLDELQHVNNVTYVGWIQEISAEHWFSVAPKSMQDAYRWVVRNHTITYHRQAVLHDKVRLQTFITDHKGPLSIRTVKMTHAKTGVKLVTSTTQWCLVDAQTLRPISIAHDIKSLF